MEKVWSIFDGQKTSLKKIYELESSRNGVLALVSVFCYLGVFVKPNDVHCPGCREIFSMEDYYEGSWKCRKNNCYRKVSVRKGSIFFNSKMTLINIIELMIAYVNTISISQTCRLTSLSSKTIRKYFNMFDSLLFEELVRNAPVLGGPGKVSNFLH
jgi:hypothetical protein